MANGHRETERSADRVLNRFPPGAASRAVTASSIGQDKQFAGTRVSLAAFCEPPLSDGVDGKRRRVVAGSHEDSASVGLRVVNAVGDGDAVGLRAEIMILYRNGFTTPCGAGVFEVANLFLLLRIDTDDGQALGGETLSLLPNIEELLIAFGMFGGGDLFAVHAQPEFQLFEQAAHRVLAHSDSQSC